MANEETLLLINVSWVRKRAGIKTVLVKPKNISRETNAANTQYYVRAMQNKPWNLVNIVSSASKRGNICCGSKTVSEKHFCLSDVNFASATNVACTGKHLGR